MKSLQKTSSAAATTSSRRKILTTTIATLAGLSLIASSEAANLYWDGNDTTANADGGAGTWNTSATNWDTAVFGGANAAWSNATPDFAIFGGASGAVTLGENITVSGLRFDTAGYTITNGANTLSFGATNNFIGFSGASSAIITGAVGGSGNVSIGLVKPLVGTTLTPFTLTLNGTSAGGWSGTTTIGALSTLALSGSNVALASTTGGITLNGGGIALVNTNSAEGALDRVNNSAITANGGTLTYTNTSGSGLTYAETIGSVALTSGQTNFVLTNNMSGGGGNIQTLTLSDLTRTGSSNNSTVTFSSAGGLNATTNLVTVAGSGTTPGWADALSSAPIIGPWATIGTAAGTQTDFAVYSGGNVVPANITSTTNASWTNSAHAYALNTGSLETINTTRTIQALRFYGASSTLTFGTGNLETYGLFFSGANTKTVNSTGGVLTTPSGGGYLYITLGQADHTISAPINDNSGTVSIVVSGIGRTLTLSGTNGFTGSVVLNSGALTAAVDANLGATGSGAAPIIVNGSSQFNANTVTYARGITVNNGAILSFNANNPTISGNVTGTGGLRLGISPFGNQVTLSGTGNNFEGPLLIAGTGTTGQAYRFQVSSLADSATANGRIVFASNAITHADGSVFQYNGATPLTLNHRVIEIASTGATPANGHQIRSSGTAILTINTDLLVTSTTAQNVRLGGTNTGDNKFAGNITNGNSAAISLTKADVGKWILSGTNTYTGVTINGFHNPITGSFVFEGMQALSPSTALQQTHAGGVGGFGVIRLLDDSATPASRSGVNLNMLASNTSHTMTLFVGNNSVANGGTGTGTTTGSTITLGNLNFTQQTTGNTNQTLAVTGANGYKLQIGAVNLPSTGSNWNGILTPTTAPLTVTGNIQQVAGSTAGTMTLTLDGTATGNLISGNILDSADATPRILALTKTNTSGSWLLSGNNAYTGNTTINGGLLEISGAGTLGSGSYAGDIAIASTNVGRLSVNSTANQILGGIISGAGALVKDNAGTLTLSGTNLYTGTTTVNGGTLLVTGSLSGSSVVAVGSAGTLGGTGTIGGNTTVADGGKLSPGTSVGTLTFGSNLDLSSVNTPGTLLFELGTPAASDRVVLTLGTLNLGFGTLGFDDFAFTTVGGFGGGTYTLFDTASSIVGSLDLLNTSGFVGGLPATLAFADGGTDLVLNVVPEPSALALLSLGTLGLLRRRRTR